MSIGAPILRTSRTDATIVEQIAEFLSDDCKPSVTILTEMDEIKRVMGAERRCPQQSLAFSMAMILRAMTRLAARRGTTCHLGDNSQASADALRGHALFYVFANAEARRAFTISESDKLPMVYLVDGDDGALMPYTGDILELNLSEWVLHNSSPKMDRLWLGSSEGELYATQFFSARRLKFVLFLRSKDLIASEQDKEGEPPILVTIGGVGIYVQGVKGTYFPTCWTQIYRTF